MHIRTCVHVKHYYMYPQPCTQNHIIRNFNNFKSYMCTCTTMAYTYLSCMHTPTFWLKCHQNWINQYHLYLEISDSPSVPTLNSTWNFKSLNIRNLGICVSQTVCNVVACVQKTYTCDVTFMHWARIWGLWNLTNYHQIMKWTLGQK